MWRIPSNLLTFLCENLQRKTCKKSITRFNTTSISDETSNTQHQEQTQKIKSHCSNVVYHTYGHTVSNYYKNRKWKGMIVRQMASKANNRHVHYGSTSGTFQSHCAINIIWYSKAVACKFNQYLECCEQSFSKVCVPYESWPAQCDELIDDGEVIPVWRPYYADDMRRNPTACAKLTNCRCKKQ